MVLFVLVLLGFFALVSVFMGDWSRAGQKEVKRQRNLRRAILIVGAVVIIAILVVALFGGIATI